MSKFAVTIESISKIYPHPNADRLELAQIDGMAYQFIIGKGQFHEGDLVVYFPIDSLLPPTVVSYMGLEGKLSGKDKNRVKTIRLRGEISQGVVSDLGILEDCNIGFYAIGADVTEMLGVTKYEVAEDIRANLGNSKTKTRTLPDMVSHYDIEGADRNVKFVNEYLFNTPVFITEKIEGSHCSISRFADGTVAVCSRNKLLEGEDNYWYKGCTNSNLFEAVEFLYQWLSEDDFTPQVVTIRGELIGPGVQGNIYDFKVHHVLVFDIELDGKPIPARRFVDLCNIAGIDTVPQLFNPYIYILDGVELNVDQRGMLSTWLNDKTLQQASNGYSQLKLDVLREGVVIRPFYEEQYVTGLGRLQLKQRSPQYLSESDL